MTPTVPDEAASTRPWGASLAMAGAMAAGLAVGRSSKLALAAGLAAAVGWKIMRRDEVERTRRVRPLPGLKDWAPGKSARAETGGCCSGEEKSAEPGACEPVHAAAEASPVGPVPQAGSSNPDEGMLFVWEQGQGETVSRGAVGTQTVWFGMPEPLEVAPHGLSPDQFKPGAVPAPAMVAEPPGPVSGEAPEGNLVSLPAVPAIAEKTEAAAPTSLPGPSPSGGLGRLGRPPRFVAEELSGGSAVIPGIGVWKPAKKETKPDELLYGPHRRVVPQAPVADRGRGHWMMLVTAVVLMIVALAMVRGGFRRDGWIKGLKLPWQVARGGVQEQPLKDAGGWTAAPREK